MEMLRQPKNLADRLAKVADIRVAEYRSKSRAVDNRGINAAHHGNFPSL